MLDGLPRVLGSPEQQGSRSSRLPERELVESEALSSSGLDTGTGSAGESEGGNGELGHLEETDVVGDGGDDDDGVGGSVSRVTLVDLAGDSGEGEGRAVDARHIESAEDGLVELGVCSAGEEAVQLHTQRSG